MTSLRFTIRKAALGARLGARPSWAHHAGGTPALLLLALLFAPMLHAQAWSGILNANRATDWTQAGIPGGIPKYTNVCATVAATGIKGWAANTAVTVGQQVEDSNGNLQTVFTAGTTGANQPLAYWQSVGTPPGIYWSTATNGTTSDGTVTWKLEATAPAYTTNTNYAVGTHVTDSNGNLETVVIAGTSGAGTPSWTTIVGSMSNNGTVTFVMGSGGTDSFNIDAALNDCGLMRWQQGYGYPAGWKILDSNGNTETITVAGVTGGGAEPAWPTTSGATTVDGGATWQMSPGVTGQVVMLQAATYYPVGIYFDGLDIFGRLLPDDDVVLRGAGTLNTKIISQGTVGCFGRADVCLDGTSGPAGSYAGSTTWTAGYTQGTSSITVGSAAGLGVGQVVILDQRDDAIGICPPSGGFGACASVAGITESGTTVTVNLSLPESYAVGNTVGVGGMPGCTTNTTPIGCPPAGVTGEYTIATTPSSTSFTYNASANSYSVVLSWSSNVATMCMERGWPMVTGSTVTITGATGYNGTYTLTGSGFNGICGSPSISYSTYALSTNPGASGVTGTATFSSLPNAGGGETIVDNGGAQYSCVGGPTCSDEAGSGDPGVGRVCASPSAATSDCNAGEISYREQQEFKKVTNITGTTLTISPPVIATNWRSGQNPGVYWSGRLIQNSGIEALTIDHSDSGEDVGGITLNASEQCWVRDVRSIEGSRNHVWVLSSFEDDIEDNYFWGSQAGASKSYGIEVYNGNSENLYQNNLCQRVPACLLPSGDWGSVYAYNYMVDSGTNTTVFGAMLSANHDSSGYDLFEGNDSPGIDIDDIHGNALMQTFFRSRIVGQNAPWGYNNRVAGTVSAYSRFTNFVGDILGTSPFQTGYQNASTYFPDQYVYSIGVEDDDGDTPNDPLTLSSLLRWGNYDNVSAAVRWCGNSSSPGWSTTCASTSEIPTAALTYVSGNAVPASTTLPASFYLASQPSFWTTPYGTPPWPAIGPDVTSGTAPDGIGGYSYAIPAQLCADNAAYDSNYQQKYSLASASAVGTEATVTFSGNGTTGAYPIAPYTTIIVSGLDSTFNGTFRVDSASYASGTTTVTYTMHTTDGSTFSNQGQIAWENILAFDATSCYPQADPPATSSVTVSGGVTMSGGVTKIQ